MLLYQFLSFKKFVRALFDYWLVGGLLELVCLPRDEGLPSTFATSFSCSKMPKCEQRDNKISPGDYVVPSYHPPPWRSINNHD